jgi:aminopeptidase N
MNVFVFIFASFFLFVSCDPPPKVVVSSSKIEDNLIFDDHSYSNLAEIRTKHLELELDVSFENKTIYGVARHTMKNKGADTAIFDIKGLKIQKITLGDKENERETDFVIGNMDKDSILGQPLLVSVSHLTSSKKYPFL